VVVIGGGITGCSVAYHLALAGWKDVLLLEKHQLTSGSTNMAAGLVTAFNPSSTMMAFRRYSVELYGELGRPDGYVERQVRGWSERYAGSRTDDLPVVDRVAGWLAARIPTSPPPALIHNDYKYDNLVLDPADPARIVGVLDWELATLGDPLMDLGTSLAYWVEAGDPPGMIAMRFGPTTLPGMMTRAELAALYAARTGRPLDHIVFYYAFGLFKTAVVAQQIYWRWKQGLTRDPRFEPFLLAVAALCEQAAAAIDRGSL
jgi:aminoglycoside phosphotransferase (APT) family kinase protein